MDFASGHFEFELHFSDRTNPHATHFVSTGIAGLAKYCDSRVEKSRKQAGSQTAAGQMISDNGPHHSLNVCAIRVALSNTLLSEETFQAV
jgi:hypothetical protein